VENKLGFGVKMVSVWLPSRHGSGLVGGCLWLQKFLHLSLALALKEPEQTTPKLDEFWLSPLSLHPSATSLKLGF